MAYETMFATKMNFIHESIEDRVHLEAIYVGKFMKEIGVLMVLFIVP
jgi:hypothetical protein